MIKNICLDLKLFIYSREELVYFIPSSILFRIKRMVTITQLGRLVLIAGALVSVILGVRLPVRKGEKFMILSKADIGAKIRNVTAELCDNNIKVLNLKVKQTSHRPPVFSLWISFLSKLDVISMDFTSKLLLGDHELITLGSTSTSFYKKYLPIFKNEIYSFNGSFKNIGIASMPKGKYIGILKAVNQDEQQVACIHMTGFVED